MRRILGIFLVVAGGAVAAQQAPFRSGVSLVTVDVTVLDKDGKPVPGLTAADFEIKLGGKVQPVRALAFVQAAPARDTAEAPAANDTPKPAAATTVAAFAPVDALEVRRTISNQDGPLIESPPPAVNAPIIAAPKPPPAGNIESRTFVVLIDDLSFPPLRGRNVFGAAQRFINGVPRVDAVGFTTTSGSITVNPTLDRKVVTDGLARVVGQYSDPRLIDSSGHSSGIGGKGSKSREEPIGIEESLTIERGVEGVLRAAVIRECFNGDASALPPGPMDIVAIDNSCVAGVRTEARRTAELTAQTRRRQLGAISSVVNAMRTASGIRHLVLVTDGVAVHLDVDELNLLSRAAATAGVQVSVVMENREAVSMDSVMNRDALETSGPRVDPGLATRIREDNRMMTSGAQSTAEAIGGNFYSFVGGADNAFARVLLASSAVYRLAVELPAGASAGKELSLSANVKRPGLVVRTNKLAVPATERAEPAAVAAPSAAAAPVITGPVLSSIDDVLKAALNANTAMRGVPIRLGATLRRSASVAGQVDVSVNVLLAPSVKAPVTVLVGLVDENNALRINRRVIDNTQQPVQFLFPVAPGSYAIRFGAAAADGALGTIELPIAARLHALGGFTASDVLTYFVGDAAQKAVLFATDDVPAPAEPATYHASIELYPAGAMPLEPPVINWTIVRDGDTKAVAIVDEDIQGRVGTDFFRSDFEMPFAQLPPGTYLVRATLMDGDKPAGSVGAVIKKK